MPEIRLKNISKSYDGKTLVLQNINLTFKDSEFTVLVGPSGCGKSTLLRILCGLETVSSGEIWSDNQNITSMEAGKRNMAMVFQNYALYPHMNVAENITFSLKMAKCSVAEIKNRLQQILGMLDLENLAERKPKDLSGGQRQRVAIARALIREPEIFLFDEPLSNLDANLRVQTRMELAELHQQLNKNMIYVTHDQTEAMTLGDNIVVLANGEIQQTGSPKALYEKPQNIFVAGFIGANKMNLIRGTFSYHKSGSFFEFGESRIKLGEQFSSDSFSSMHQKEVVLGIRPEHIKLCSQGEPEGSEGSHLKLKIVLSEYIGHHYHLMANLVENSSGRGPKTIGEQDDKNNKGNQSQLYRFSITVDSADELTVGGVYLFQLQMSHIHLFDAVTEQRFSE